MGVGEHPYRADSNGRACTALLPVDGSESRARAQVGVVVELPAADGDLDVGVVEAFTYVGETFDVPDENPTAAFTEFPGESMMGVDRVGGE